MTRKLILIAGGAGYIGSYTNKLLNEKGYDTLVLDNLSSGDRRAVTRGTLIKGDIGDSKLLDEIFNKYPISAVMHFAAYLNVGESVLDPAKYYQNNVCNTLVLLQAMLRHNVNNFIFSSSAAIYGSPEKMPVTEKEPPHPINPYGETKLIVEHILRDFSIAYGLHSSILRYFNVAGGDPSGEVKNFRVDQSNLIPVALRSLLQPEGSITIFGTDYPTPDGTGVRDYIHLHDLAEAHILALTQLFREGQSTHYNLGNGQGFSVRQVLDAVESVTGRKLNIIEGTRRAGDPAILVADSTKAKKNLNWHPKYAELDKIVSDAWQTMKIK